MSKKNILFIGSLILGTLAFAGGDLNLSSEIPICSEEIVKTYENDQQNQVTDIIEMIRKNEVLIATEYKKPEKDWDEIKRLTKIGGELKGKLEYIILARN